MKKDPTRDYITECFRIYAAMGMPSAEAIEETMPDQERRSSASLMSDIHAVHETMALLEEGEKTHIIAAVKAVYFAYPNQQIHRSTMSDRVRAFSTAYHADERTVYRWLKEAREMCAQLRGLTTKKSKRCQ